jgi:nucleotide-binding universal stress UspA family protein
VFELGTDGPTKILVGVDGSDTSLRAAAYAAGLVRRQNARLIVLYVRTVGIAATNPAAYVGMREVHDQTSADLRSEVDAGASRLGIEIEFVEREGNPFKAMVKLAEELRVDALVVGASTAAGHRLIGSLAVHLVKLARWPVTVVP